MSEPLLTAAQVLVALEEMPPMTVYTTVTFDGALVFVARADGTVPGEYLFVVFDMSERGKPAGIGPEFDLSGFHRREDLASVLISPPTMDDPPRWMRDECHELADELLGGLRRHWESGALGPEAAHRDYVVHARRPDGGARAGEGGTCNGER